MVSSPPPVRFKILLFGVFVLLVAVVTFMVLYMLKPFERHGGKAPAVEPQEAAEEVEAPAADQPEVASAPEKSAAPKSTSALEEKPDAPASEPEPASSPAIKIGPPACQQESGIWQVAFKADKEPKYKHFTLKDPPRLAVDFLGASYTGQEKLLDCPAPFVSKIRVGEKPEYTRFVIDFADKKIPKFEVTAEKESVILKFTQ